MPTPTTGIFDGFTGPLIYGATGGIATPMDGIPLDVADRSFNRSFIEKVLGNGLYGGPPGAGTAGSSGGFTLTENVSNGSVALSTGAGQLILTSGATTQSVENLQYLHLPFRYSTLRRHWVFGRFNLDSVVNGQFFFGLHESQTAIINTNALAAGRDYIGFSKLGAPTDLTFGVAKNAAETTQAMGLTLVNAGFFICGFTIVGGKIRAFAVLDPNDLLLLNPSFLGPGILVSETNAPNTVDTYLSVVVGCNSGQARVLTCDWLFACAEHA